MSRLILFAILFLPFRAPAADKVPQKPAPAPSTNKKAQQDAPVKIVCADFLILPQILDTRDPEDNREIALYAYLTVKMPRFYRRLNFEIGIFNTRGDEVGSRAVVQCVPRSVKDGQMDVVMPSLFLKKFMTPTAARMAVVKGRLISAIPDLSDPPERYWYPRKDERIGFEARFREPKPNQPSGH